MILSVTVLVILLFLLVWDSFQFSREKWNELMGHEIITIFHLVLILLLGSVTAIAWKRKPETPSGITLLHKTVTGITVPFGMACVTLIAFGDVLAYGSTAAYLGTVFAFAAVFLMPYRYSLALYGMNMALMIFLLILARAITGLDIDTQLINVVIFTVIAFMLSRILFLYSRKDFSNRLLIQKQSDEISRQNTEKEALIQELRSALDEVKTLSGFLPICASCKKIRDDDGYWNQLETYLHKHSNAQFSHGYCPECAEKIFSELTGESFQWKKAGKREEKK